ncbi:IPT/TIG domain-containing protein [Streptomyces ovatisporus]|uniref:IPT/TIG domain-containing protein n=1 Tax=Streptomyces ovatisporus TaxID=1128682 RepID=A0ABV9A7G8_9ACTN
MPRTIGDEVNDRDRGETPASVSALAAAPTLGSVVPAGGPPAGNNTVTLTGTGFTGVTAVNFGSRASPGFTVNSLTKITALAPAGTGTVLVTVRAGTSTSNAVNYTYAALPTLSGVSPEQGPVSGGTTVTLTGTGLTGATAVNFGTAPAQFTVVSATQITAVTPAGTGAVPVTVTTSGGTSGAVYFFYAVPPTLSKVFPGRGPTSGGTTVVLTGAGLTGATAVSFGGTPAGFTVDSSTQITAVTPVRPAGSAPVTVTTAGGVSNPAAYTYVPPPVLSALTPLQGPISSGAVVTLTGSGLTTTSAVRFGAVLAPFTVESDTSVAAVAPAGPAGTVPVSVTTAGGTSAALSYTRVPPPML